MYSVAGATIVYEWRVQQTEKRRKDEESKVLEAARRESLRINEAKQWAEFAYLKNELKEMRDITDMLNEEVIRLREREHRREADENKKAGWLSWTQNRQRV